MAEQTGIAFQLTNILRDVREDAERGRIYLPLEDLEQFRLTLEQLLRANADQRVTVEERGLMAMEAGALANITQAADSLLPLISPDSRAALWVLVTIYRRLLQRIENAHYEVFAARVRVPTMEKLWILVADCGWHFACGCCRQADRKHDRLAMNSNEIHDDRRIPTAIRDVAVVGGGLAGLSAACALAESGYRVHLVERRPYVGGRASSYEHPGTGEVVDNCQHVLLGCCTNLIVFYRQLGVADRIRWFDRITFIEPGGRQESAASRFFARAAAQRDCLSQASALSLADKLAISRGMMGFLRGVPADERRRLCLLAGATRPDATRHRSILESSAGECAE